MTPEEIKMQEAHKKAMEALEEFNKQAKGLTNTINDITGK